MPKIVMFQIESVDCLAAVDWAQRRAIRAPRSIRPGRVDGPESRRFYSPWSRRKRAACVRDDNPSLSRSEET